MALLRTLSLFLTGLFFSLATGYAVAQSTADINTADVELTSNLKHLIITASQPGGGCAQGYNWNSTFGGCRLEGTETEQEVGICPAGYVGDRVRSRSRKSYTLQSNGANIRYTDWTAWEAWDNSTCKLQEVTIDQKYDAKNFWVFSYLEISGMSFSPYFHIIWDGKQLPTASTQSGYTNWIFFQNKTSWDHGGYRYTRGKKTFSWEKGGSSMLIKFWGINNHIYQPTDPYHHFSNPKLPVICGTGTPYMCMMEFEISREKIN